MGYSLFGHGSFPSAESIGARLLEEIAKLHGRTPRQVALNSLTHHPTVFNIPKAGRPDHVQENSGGAGQELNADDLIAIDRAFLTPHVDLLLELL